MEQVKWLLIQFIIMTIDQLATRLKCSKRTIQRKLSELRCIASYNFNGRFFVLPDKPNFDENGLWQYKDARFSKWGGVEPTLVQLIQRSPKGLTPSEVNKILQVRANVQLGKLVRKDEIVRVREGRNMVYFSAQEAVRNKQMKQRKIEQKQKLPAEKAIPRFITKDYLIKVLSVIVKHHAIKKAKLEQLLQKEGKKINRKVIDWIFKRFEIEKKGSP